METSNRLKANDFVVIQHYLDQQDPTGFSLLYETYAPQVRKISLRLLKEENLAEDATQEIFIRILQHLSNFRKESKFSTWLYAVASNYCIDYLKKRQRMRIALSENLEAYHLTDEEPDYEYIHLQMVELEQVMQKLPENYRRILHMKFKEHMSIKAIADELNKTESAVKMLIKRAKEKARLLRAQ